MSTTTTLSKRGGGGKTKTIQRKVSKEAFAECVSKHANLLNTLWLLAVLAFVSTMMIYYVVHVLDPSVDEGATRRCGVVNTSNPSKMVWPPPLHAVPCSLDTDDGAQVGPGGCPSGQACYINPCGFKLSSGLDISVHGASNEDGSPHEDTPIARLMVFYSLVPYGMAFLYFLWVIITRSTMGLIFMLLLGVVTVLNEFILKKIIKQQRPPGSCLYGHSYGMPSGHAATTFAILTATLFETLWDRPRIPVYRKVITCFVALFLFAPVPYSRVYLSDHWPAQVAWGCVLGTAVAALLCYINVNFVKGALQTWESDGHFIPLCRMNDTIVCSLRSTYRNENYITLHSLTGCGNHDTSMKMSIERRQESEDGDQGEKAPLKGGAASV